MFGDDMNNDPIHNNFLGMMIFDKYKTGNTIVDSMFAAIMLSFVSYFIQLLHKYALMYIRLDYIFSSCLFDWYYKKNTIEYDGKISLSNHRYDTHLCETSIFGNRFKAIWEFIIRHIEKNDTIYHIKEYNITKQTEYNSHAEHDLGIYMVVQDNQFLISKELEIYAHTFIVTPNDDNNQDNKNKKTTNKMERITIKLFSYKTSIHLIKQFVDELTNEYLSSLHNSRMNQRFIYKLIKTKIDESRFEMWNETPFSSTRTFDNLFFSKKPTFLKELDFFLANKEWYFDTGIPYSLGIGMHGPPGTGKTSLIKALANYTNRHIVVISLKLIKTKRDLESIFFEDRYCFDNKNRSITFDKKIIVFEDIDCMGDIVLNREKVRQQNTPTKKKERTSKTNRTEVMSLLESFAINDSSNQNTTDKSTKISCISPIEDPITLDDILNLWDGIRETPGRIMVISSNHYHDLDPALIRPGRIDMTLELSYATHQTIKEIYMHLFKAPLEDCKLTKIKENVYSPAEIINIFMMEERNPERFLARLASDKK